jgi:hypothetical protein
LILSAHIVYLARTEGSTNCSAITETTTILLEPRTTFGVRQMSLNETEFRLKRYIFQEKAEIRCRDSAQAATGQSL